MNFTTCAHVNAYKSTVGIKPLKIIHACCISCISEETRKIKAKSVCHTCGAYGIDLHACLYCVYIGCYSAKHIHEHAHSLNHDLAIDLSHGTPYCFYCQDVIYDPDFEAIAKRYKSCSSRRLGIKPCYIPWEPNDFEIALLLKNRMRRHITQNSYIGLRGVLNLGKTCFMNSVIQALIHTPLLRDYFLSDLHHCNFADRNQCMACEMARLFQEHPPRSFGDFRITPRLPSVPRHTYDIAKFYSGKTVPLFPHHLLNLMWTEAKHLAEDVQHDAQEFFMAILDILHCHCKGPNKFSNNNPSDCNCIIDQIFTGSYQSDKICQQCKTVSRTIEPFRDIPLGLINLDDGSQLTTLNDCLKRYTRIENMEEVFCDNCRCLRDSTKQMKMTKLPVIVCFHLKRFDNSKKTVRKRVVPDYSRRKITTYVSFSPSIDMTPVTSSYREDGCNDTNNDNLYSLFAVVNHLGDSYATGHYIAYIRQQKDQWFKCDDDIITLASEKEVLESQGYLLFYQKQLLEYE